jgi:hypothetical protein
MSEEGGGFFTPIIVSVASLMESMGIPHASAITYSKMLVYGGTALIIVMFVGWVIRLFRGK